MAIIPDSEEILDIVNGNEEVVGQISHEDAYNVENLHGNFLRASNVFIVNDRQELWIPRRTAHKKIAPSGLDYSAGEHAQAGESYIAAALRGMAEELNIVATETDLAYIGKTVPRADVPPYFAAHYLYFSNDVPRYNPDDFVSYEWLAPQVLRDRLQSGKEVAKESLIEAVELYLAYLTQHNGK